MRDTSVSWQKILAQGFASVNELLEFLSLPVTVGSIKAEKTFKTRVPRGFAARMEPGNPKDPLLLQVLAVDEELHEISGFATDPLAEQAAICKQGLLHKYQGRVLLTLTGVCAVNCRYCFRRHFPYQANNPGWEGWESVLNYIQKNPTIHEVILSGGDPLLATNAVLRRLLNQLEQMSQVRTLRIHSRVPVVLPERIDRELLELLSSSRLHKVMVIHSNHARELDNAVRWVCKELRQVDCHLLNQSVLLKGVNDDVETLITLSEQLFDCGVLPYYLHLLDRVKGAAHFDLPLETALALYRQLQKKLPGYLVPRLAREEPGKESKTLLI
ncbi:EF-P beta-lysylation protein EpmB [Legionella clemsonensis]|uniref:L-lysine 2,3-aminomutase n=1 Tax=Legionella clemsonensis TaxID=1867846 RepID=A0A222P602_9GAMM|nr:EF-P beta-lysylation protein EpmB [Legionella clemsonensis]ASQ47253.1 L-lysine 2,3-aminomutase [Legionella clemsonensis]